MKTRTVHALPPRLPVVTVMRLEAEVLDDLEPLGDELVRAGTTPDLPDELAALWLKQGYAEPVAVKKKSPDK